MDEELIKQVQLLTDQIRTVNQTQEAQSRTLEAVIQRLNQVTGQFGDTTAQLLQTKEALETTNEALMESLSENDSNQDDFLTGIAALTQVTKDLRSVLPASMQQQQQSGLEGSNV